MFEIQFTYISYKLQIKVIKRSESDKINFDGWKLFEIFKNKTWLNYIFEFTDQDQDQSTANCQKIFYLRVYYHEKQYTGHIWEHRLKFTRKVNNNKH